MARIVKPKVIEDAIKATDPRAVKEWKVTPGTHAGITFESSFSSMGDKLFMEDRPMAVPKSQLEKTHWIGDSTPLPDVNGVWVYIETDHGIPSNVYLISVEGDSWWYTLTDDNGYRRVIDILPKGGIYIFVY